MKKQLQKGFTMIELAIVIAIIGILVAVSVPFYKDMTTSATTATNKTAVANVKSALRIAITNKAGLTPLNPYPTVTELGAGLDGSTATATGLCVAPDKRVVTYMNADKTGPTTAVGDTVRSVGDSVIDDAANC